MSTLFRTALAAGLFFTIGLSSSASAAPSFFSFLHPPAVSPAALHTIDSFPAFKVGPLTGRHVDIFFLPTCPHCHALWREIQELRALHPSIAALRIHWIPVLLSSRDTRMLAPYWKGVPHDAKELKGLMTASAPPSAGLVSTSSRWSAQLAPALAWLRHTGAQSVPVLIRHPKAGDGRIRIGAPPIGTVFRWLKGNSRP